MALKDRGRGPAVVLLHGQPGEGRDWDEVADHLAGRVRVIVPDRPGYGRTGGRAVGIAANADIVVGVLDHLGLERALLAGHSWGGAVALDLAERYPDRVAGLVLAASVGGAGSIDVLDRLLALRLVGPLLSLIGLGVLRAPRVGRRLAGRTVPVASEVFWSHQTNWLQAWRSFAIEQRALVAELPSIAARLGEIRIPTIVVTGDRDRVVRPRSQHDLTGSLPGARQVTLARVGHILPREAPEQLAQVIVDLALG